MYKYVKMIANKMAYVLRNFYILISVFNKNTLTCLCFKTCDKFSMYLVMITSPTAAVKILINLEILL